MNTLRHATESMTSRTAFRGVYNMANILRLPRSSQSLQPYGFIVVITLPHTRHHGSFTVTIQRKGNTDDAVQPATQTGMTSNTLEKGIVYFFIRERLNTDKPEGVDDTARSYMLLHSIPKDLRLGRVPIGDTRNHVNAQDLLIGEPYRI
ncbi:hypothetical protein BKA56DRAFT_591029 [Ilyonectria sp. MPI-CAGE-AT-0026]|nr:hypothetical protein BKA56DRAFT_591029 [Ilyonectria sp. MPI-CAGE-AT-0026]